MRETVLRRYETLAQEGELQADEGQRALARALDEIGDALRARGGHTKKSALGWFLSRGASSEPVRGLYIWGSVGRGKTLLMDLFFAAAPDIGKRRAHFHDFMADVHERIHRYRERVARGEVKGEDPIPPVAAELAQSVRLLCFDEFAVYDIADAMILGRLFKRLFERGVTIVATSNVAPDGLYPGGLNRQLFLPFIRLIKEQMNVFHLQAPRDYRLGRAAGAPIYLTPDGSQARACLDRHFADLAGDARPQRRALRFRGREIEVPAAADGVARFSFEELFVRPLAAADYLKLAETFHTIIVEGIPVLAPDQRNEAKRLINFVDALYDRRVRLIVSAEAEPVDLWTGTDGAETFEFARTASRLMEMRSSEYWEAARAFHPL